MPPSPFTRKRILVGLLSIGLVWLLVWQFRHNPEWRQFSWSAVWAATQAARGWYILGAVGMIYASYLIRAVRWQGLMAPRGRFWPVLKGTVIGFTGTALLGRPGELVRPYYIARKHRGDLSPQLAVWLLERTFDMAGVVLLVGLDLALDPRIHMLTREGGYQHAFQRAGLWLSVAIVVLLVLLYVFHLKSRHILAWLKQRDAVRPSAIRKKLEYFLETLAQGTVGLTRGRTLLVAILFTLLLWFDISGAIWMVVRAYPGMLPTFSFSEALLLMGLTAIGSVVQLPAVGGGFQVLTIFGLTKVFGADTAAATSAALIVWLVCFYAIAPFGAGLATHEGVSWRGIEHEAEAKVLAG
ncbi:MAG TPA: lysylphosphatidylglycerol synthase transmembrane domain-containing protein [Terriglobales bacterium]|nr:lysylphosphatidylglycerol synthase transmembrane domain-containing protein [Terriglobales bacterium]